MCVLDIYTPIHYTLYTIPIRHSSLDSATKDALQRDIIFMQTLYEHRFQNSGPAAAWASEVRVVYTTLFTSTCVLFDPLQLP